MAGDAMTRAGGAGAPARPRGRAEAGLSIVVPLFNEADNLATLHARVVEVARTLKAERALATEAVYVDDGSRDATTRTVVLAMTPATPDATKAP